MDNDNLIRQRIQKIVLLSGLSKPKFAEKIGFNKANLNLILNGNRKVPESLVFAIISNKMASFEYLVDGYEPPVSKSQSDISSGGNTTINNGESEAQSLRADAITNRMLDMLSMSVNNINDIQEKLSSMGRENCANLSKIEQRLEGRESLSGRLLNMIEEKDRQLKEKDEQIERLLDLLSDKERG